MTEIERRKQNWIDFADVSSPVTRIVLVNCWENIPSRPPLWWEYADQRVEYAYVRYQRQMENLEWIHDNTIPYLDMITGTEIFAEAFGCKVHKPLDNNPFALPCVFSVQDLHKIKIPKVEDTNLSILFDMADRLKDRAGKEALLSMPDIQTPIDVAALIWDKNDFYAAMYEEPEAVKELAGMVKEFMFSFFDQWFARYGQEFIAHFPEYYMPFGITVSEDEIGAVSDEMYHEFFEPELHELSCRYKAIGIHCCADSKHQWENLKQVPNLKILNLHRDTAQTLESLQYFRNTCGQFPGVSDIDISSLPDPESLHIVRVLGAPTREEAIRLAEANSREDSIKSFS